MKKTQLTLKIMSLSVVFILTISSLAFASFVELSPNLLPEHLIMVMVGLGLIAMGNLVRGALSDKKQEALK